MAHAGQDLTNPVTGERLVFLAVPDDRAQAFVFEDHWTRAGHRVAAHIHPEMTERWELVAGAVTFRIGGVEHQAQSGDIVVAPAGVPHMAWMDSEEPAVMRVTITPALRWPEFIEEMFQLAELGRTDEAGLPNEEELIRLFRRYPREIAPPEPL